MNKYERALYYLFVGKDKPISAPKHIPRTFLEFVTDFKKDLNDNNYNCDDIEYPCFNCNGSGVVCIAINSNENGLPVPVKDSCPVCNGAKGISKIKFFAFYEKTLKNHKEYLKDYRLELQKLKSLLSKLSEEEQGFLYSIIWYL